MNNGSPSNNWWYHIVPYLDFPQGTYDWPDLQKMSSSNGVLHCPSEDLTDKVTYPTLIWSSYKMTARFRLASPEGPGTSRGLLISRIKRPSQLIMVADGRTHPEFSNYDSTAKATGLVYLHRQASIWITRPFISAYWGWSGYLKSLETFRQYDLVKQASDTPIAPISSVLLVLSLHVLLGFLVTYLSVSRSVERR